MNSTAHPIHPIYKAFCETHQKQLAEAFKHLDLSSPESQYQAITEIRAAAEEFALRVPLPEVLRSQQLMSGGPENVKVGTTIFRPIGSEKEVLPVILFCHGGGWILGSATTHAKLAIDLCINTHAAVVVTEYSLSPEVKFPVANEQTYAALCWIHENGRSINLNPDKICIAGDSAGGNMATVVAMMAKDRGMKDAIKSQVLMYPAVAMDNTPYNSYKMYGQGDCYLSLKETEICASAYISPSVLGTGNIYVAPILATADQIKGLPPALVLTSECDVLRDEGEIYVSQLIAAGVYTVGMRVLGTIHAFMSTPFPETPQYRASLKTIVAFIIDQFELA